jgi:psp operon transcriptional activator
VLYLPPLRERQGDIPLLAQHFAARMAFEVGRDTIPRFSQRAMSTLEAYHWPGNIRELKNVVERAAYRSDSSVIDSIVFNPFENPYATAPPAEKVIAKKIPPAISYQAPIEDDIYVKPFDDAVWELKVRLLENALIRAKFNQKKAARILGMTYHQFRALYRKYRKKQSV